MIGPHILVFHNKGDPKIDTKILLYVYIYICVYGGTPAKGLPVSPTVSPMKPLKPRKGTPNSWKP